MKFEVSLEIDLINILLDFHIQSVWTTFFTCGPDCMTNTIIVSTSFDSLARNLIDCNHWCLGLPFDSVNNHI